VLPAELRQQDQIEAGQEFAVKRLDGGRYVPTRLAPRRNEGRAQLLQACPVRGWFQPLDRSATTNDVASRRDE